MGANGQQIRSILREIQGLLHEAKSNVEIDGAKGQALINRLAGAVTSDDSSGVPAHELTAIIREVGEGIQASIEKELSIDNPEAAVLQIRGLLTQLEQLA